MQQSINRRLDPFYQEEDHFSKPKEYFKETLNIIKANSSEKKASLLDIGCAAGDFIRFCAKNFSDWDYSGLDVFDENLVAAKQRYPKGVFFNFDMSSENQPISKQFDIITMLGTLSIFSDIRWIDNFVKFLKEDGLGIIFGMINPYPYDVFVKLKKFKNEQFEYGWNSWCFETIQDEFKKLNCITSIKKWNLPIEIPARIDAPLRSWTMKLENGMNLVTNGSRMIHDFAFIEIKKS